MSHPDNTTTLRAVADDLGHRNGGALFRDVDLPPIQDDFALVEAAVSAFANQPDPDVNQDIDGFTIIEVRNALDVLARVAEEHRLRAKAADGLAERIRDIASSTANWNQPPAMAVPSPR